MSSSNSPFQVSGSGSIPIPDRTDGFQFDPKDLSVTPGGSIYGTTPGGTRIKYDRDALLILRNSPLSQTPPKDLPSIPGVTRGSPQKQREETPSPVPADQGDDTLFKMDD
mmetsp:Transcript_22030/g.30300  ORF Transcript_22030/g.30300 Transcript_22030/m.30300 type:complete len:110 (+) Transcript_22030:27-356(+)